MEFKRLEAIVSIRAICKNCQKEVYAVVDLDDLIFGEEEFDGPEEFLKKIHTCQLGYTLVTPMTTGITGTPIEVPWTPTYIPQGGTVTCGNDDGGSECLDGC